MDNLSLINKEDFKKKFNLRSVYFSIASVPDVDCEKQALTEHFVTKEAFVKYFLKNDPDASLGIVGDGYDLFLSRDLPAETYRKHNLTIFPSLDSVIEVFSKGKNLNTSQDPEIMAKLLTYFKDPNNTNDLYPDLRKVGIKLIPDKFYVNHPLINKIEDFDALDNIDEIYLLNDVLSVNYTKVELTKDSIDYKYLINFKKDNVVIDLESSLNLLGEKLFLRDFKQTINGYKIDGSKKIYTSQLDLMKEVNDVLETAKTLWNREMNVSREVGF